MDIDYDRCNLYNENKTSSLIFPSVDENAVYDIIFGSDMIASQNDAIGVAIAVNKYLNHENGICLFVCPLPQHRWSTEFLVPCLQNIGIKTYYKLFHHSSYTHPYVLTELQTVWSDIDNNQLLLSSKMAIYREFLEQFNNQKFVDNLIENLSDIKDNCSFMVVLGMK